MTRRRAPGAAALAAAAAALFGGAAPARAEAPAPLTPAVIEGRVDDAFARIRSDGLSEACAAFADASGPFLQDEAYVFVLTQDGALLCHPRPDLIRRTQTSYIPQMLGAAAAAQPEGAWSRYPWPHPVTRRVAEKSTYCKIVPPIAVCAGAHFAGLS